LVVRGGGIDPDKWKRFRRGYETEIGHHHELIKVLQEKARKEHMHLWRK